MLINKPSFREILKKKKIEEGKEAQLEKNDFLALLIAGFTVFVPVILIFAGVIALFIWLFTLYFH